MKDHKLSIICLFSAFLLLAACGGGGGGNSTPETDPLVELTWKSGTPHVDWPAVYGTKGVPHSANMPGGRAGAKGFPGSNGDLWFFGGNGLAAAGEIGRLSDMWRYVPSTGQWAWISGSDEINDPGSYGTLGEPGTENTPGGRSNVNGWTDADGTFWIFGGYGYATSSTEGCLNDMWKFNPIDSTWTWVSGSNSVDQPGAYGVQGTASPDNIPGARYSSATWTDSEGNVWLYGGYGYAEASDTDKGYLDDLWKYDPDDNTWTWIGGSSAQNAEANYEEDSANPGARAYSATWTDSAGNFWMLGGTRSGIGGSSFAELNDLWRYNLDDNEWTWVSGDDEVDQPGTYGTKGEADPQNGPGARYACNSVSWVDSGDNLWLFGGRGYGSDISGSGYGALNDHWVFKPADTTWTWTAGSKSVNQPGVYETMGTYSANNRIGGRYGAGFLEDVYGNYWIFGGYGYDQDGTRGYLNDLWMVDPQ